MKAIKLKQRKGTNDEMVSFRKLLLCISFSSFFSLAKLCHKVPM